MEHSGLYYGAAYEIDNVPPEQIREDLAAMGTELFSGKHMDEGEPVELKGRDVKILEGDL